MIRGTTPTEVYKITGTDVDLSKCKQIWVTIVDFASREHFWDMDRLTIDPEQQTVSLTLSQEETFSFAVGQAYAQIRFLYDDDSAFASKKIKFVIEDIKKGGVIA